MIVRSDRTCRPNRAINAPDAGTWLTVYRGLTLCPSGQRTVRSAHNDARCVRYVQRLLALYLRMRGTYCDCRSLTLISCRCVVTSLLRLQINVSFCWTVSLSSLDMMSSNLLVLFICRLLTAEHKPTAAAVSRACAVHGRAGGRWYLCARALFCVTHGNCDYKLHTVICT